MFVKRLFLVALLVAALFLVAARPLQETSPGVTVLVQLALAAFTALVGWPALLSVIVIAGQFFGWLTAAASETFIFWANVVVFVGIFILAILGKIDLVNQVDLTFGNIAQLLTYIMILLGAPIAFERTKSTEERFRATRMFQARIMSRVK